MKWVAVSFLHNFAQRLTAQVSARARLGNGGRLKLSQQLGKVTDNWPLA